MHTSASGSHTMRSWASVGTASLSAHLCVTCVLSHVHRMCCRNQMNMLHSRWLSAHTWQTCCPYWHHHPASTLVCRRLVLHHRPWQQPPAAGCAHRPHHHRAGAVQLVGPWQLHVSGPWVSHDRRANVPANLCWWLQSGIGDAQCMPNHLWICHFLCICNGGKILWNEEAYIKTTDAFTRCAYVILQLQCLRFQSKCKPTHAAAGRCPSAMCRWTCMTTACGAMRTSTASWHSSMWTR